MSKSEWQQQQACLRLDYGKRKASISSITSDKSMFILHIDNECKYQIYISSVHIINIDQIFQK